jgi:N-acetyl-gamma-glutamyl-phosphate reductase
MISVKIIGAGGYGGVGLIELLLGHPDAKISMLVDLQDVGKKISALYPHLLGFCDEQLISPDSPLTKEPVDVVFFSTPDGVGMESSAAELEMGAKVIDYSGDFRFNTKDAYAEYASRIGRNIQHSSPELVSKSVYGLAELHRDKLTSETRLVGNPGCFATSCILGLAPAVKYKLIDLKSIICDCKTGISGAGKKPLPSSHYSERYDQMNAYKLAGHQHVCEIERELGLLAEKTITITFTAQVVPACRGIMSCLYGTLVDNITIKQVLEAYREFHKDNSFVRIFDRNSSVGTIHVRGTNYCNLVVDIDERTKKLRVISYIDNLVKGQAGNALQNMNLLFALDETTGLKQPGQYP